MNFKACITLLIGLLCSVLSTAQRVQRELNAGTCFSPPKLDGVMNEDCWASSSVASEFIQLSPQPGAPMSQNSEVKVVYTNEAVYVGFMNYDSAPDSILKQLVGRDNSGNRDYCGITFCCYRDGINGFGFFSSPLGEQLDVRFSGDGDEDVSWNAVWACEAAITDKGWCAEFKIPYAALRFPDAEEQVWDINFEREIRRVREVGHWSVVNPQAVSPLVQMGLMKGIKGIVPPARVFFYPYLSSYFEQREVTDAKPERGFSYNVGMDVKIGLNDAFTLDATLIPDFGQTISDQQILNLTPFEIQFQDNRQFFLEGTEIFSKAGLFYSRRVGGEPIGYSDVENQLREGERVVKNPNLSQLLNAVKVSGRDRSGLGIGVFNAITGPEFATIENEEGERRNVKTSPLSNFNVMVFDQNLANNSFITITNTNVTRSGSAYDANVTGYNVNLRNKANTYGFSSYGAYNQKMGADSKAFDKRERSGFSHGSSYGKISGNFQWETGYYLTGDTYDPNDMGFLEVNNNQGYFGSVSYSIFKPFWKFNNLWSNFSAWYENLYRPNTFSTAGYEAEIGLTNRKFHTAQISTEGQPVRGYDYFEPRVWGKKFITYTYRNIGGWISTDYRLPFALDIGSWYSKFENEGRHRFNWRISPRVRVNDHLQLIYVYSRQNHFNDLGFATFDKVQDPERQNPIFGKRDVVAHTNVLTISYALNPFMSANCRIRHYWGFSKYKEFYNLLDSGELGPTDFVGFDNGDTSEGSTVDRNFNSFTVDLFYRWIFTPGSELVLGWQNDITQDDNAIPSSLREDLEYTFSLPARNVFSIRMIYFLDYRLFSRNKGEAIMRNSNK